MSGQLKRNATECNVDSFTRGLRVWWMREGQTYLKELYTALVFGGAFTIALTIIVHVFFPLGVLLSFLLPVDTPAPASYLAFEHASDVVVMFTSLGIAPIVAMAMFAIWVRHVCSMGNSNP